MASDYEDLPQTPVVSRRIVKLTRKKQISSSTSDANILKKNKKKKDKVEEDDIEKLPEKSPLVKSLDISKILGKVKNPTNYSGYSTNSSFSGNSNFNNNWKTESLFDDNGEDDLFTDQNIEEQLKKKKERQREIRRQKEKSTALEKDNLLRDRATKFDDPNPPLYPSSSPAKESSPVIPTLPSPPPPSPPPPSAPPVKKRGRPRKNAIKSKVDTVATKKPKKKEETAQSKEEVVAPTAKKRKAQPTSDADKREHTKNLRSKRRKNEIITPDEKPKKSKKDTSSSFSLFEVLDFDDNKQKSPERKENGGEDDNVFVLESPVKKGRKRKNAKTKESKRSTSALPEKEDDYLLAEKRRAEEELERLKEQEQREILAEIAKHEKEEKERLKQEREAKLEQKKAQAEEEKKRLLEARRNRQIEKQKKQKKLEMLEKLKDSTSSIMNKKVETIIIPLKDANEDTSNSNIKLRRSSLTARGRRLSSVGNGFIATPHDDIPNNELHKHIDMSLPDSHKLKQLLVWLSKRLIKQGWDDNFDNEKDDDVRQKGKMICEIILKEFVDDLIQGRVDVDWWGSGKSLKVANEPIIVHKNKENVENEKKLSFYENEVKKLEREEKIWQELKIKNTSAEHDLILKEIQSNQPVHISDEKFIPEENEKLQNMVATSSDRADKLERLVHRLQVSNELIQRIMTQKNKLVAQQIKQQSQIDALDLLRRA